MVADFELRDAFAGRDAELFADDIDARHEFGNGMLDLQSRVHLHEIHGVRFQIENEFDGARADVTHFVGDCRGVLQHRLTQIPSGNIVESDSSRIFCLSRCTLQSRSPSTLLLPCTSRSNCASM